MTIIDKILGTETHSENVDPDAPPEMDNYDHVYEDGFPHEVAGHVEAAGINLDGAINTPQGHDIGYAGESVDSEPAERRHIEGAGAETVERGIDRTVERAKDASKPRKPVNDTADGFVRYDTYNFNAAINALSLRVALQNSNRARITLIGSGLIGVSSTKPNDTSRTNGPGQAQVPIGVPLVLRHQKPIWVTAADGTNLSVIEENFAE